MIRAGRLLSGFFVCATVATAAAAATVAPVAPAEVKLGDYRDIKLANGARLLLLEKHDVPLVAFEGWMRGGSLADPASKEGVASLTAALLRKGAGSRTARQIADAVDGVGGTLVASAALERTQVSGEFMARDAALMVDLLADLLRRPTFPEEELVKLRTQTAQSIAAAKDNPNAILDIYGENFFYSGHPYGRPVAGDESTVAALTAADVRDYYRNNYGGDRLVLAVVGDFASAEMERMLRKALGDWKAAAASAAVAAPPVRGSGGRVLLVDKPDATQTYFWIGSQGVARGERERVPLELANTGYGGRFTSILNTELRIKSGLTYGARSILRRHTHPGTVAIRSFTKTESTGKAIDLALETLARLRREGLDDATVASVKSYALGQFPPDYETGNQLAAALAELAFFGLGRDEIEGRAARVMAATRQDIAGVVHRVYPAPENLVFVLVGNAAAIRETAARYGKVAEVKLSAPILTNGRR